MENRGMVSVVIPTYKRPNVISRAIESISSQTYDNIEIIVVDDNGVGTVEQMDTQKVVAVFGDKVKYIVHENNKGGSAARNSGWRVSNGEYITFVDDDDELSSEKIEKQVRSLKGHDSSWGVSYTAYQVKMPNGTRQKSDKGRSGDVYLQALARTLYMGSGSNMLIRKSLVDSIGGYDESFKRNQDIEFMTRLAKVSKFVFIPECLLTVHYEVRQFKRTYEFLDGVALYYLERFKKDIDELPDDDRKKVTTIISLDRARVACNFKEYSAAKEILKINHVKTLSVCRYIYYLAHRYLFKKSYGFYY
jgi:glycosyltransferase involved in cell wall biosynthesis